MSEYFAYVTGVVTIIAFIIQVRDIFPTHREEGRGALYIAFGAFLGTLLGLADRVQVKTPIDIHPVQLLLIIVLVLLMIAATLILFAAVMSPIPNKRNELYNVSGSLVLIFFVTLAVTGFSFGVSSIGQHEPKLSDQEVIAAVNEDVSIGDLGRALTLLEDFRLRFASNDPRRVLAEKRIETLKSKIAKPLGIDDR